MCHHPVTVSNPYLFSPAYQYHEGVVKPFDRRFVPSTATIEVPCGKCAQCRSSYFVSLMQRAQMECLTSYAYMVTLTYDDDHLPYICFTNSDTLEYTKVFYSDYRDIQNMVKRMRNDPLFIGRSFRFLYANEYGSRRFRPHHHMIFFVSKLSSDSDETPTFLETALSQCILKNYAKNVGTRKHPVYEPLFKKLDYIDNQGNSRGTFQCELIVNKNKHKDVNSIDSINDDDSVAAAVQYVLSYVNKPSRFDADILPSLDHLSRVLHSDDFRKLNLKLKSQIKFSKHFGWGFYDNGSKVVPSLSFEQMSSRRRYFYEFYSSLPDTFEDFLSFYPNFGFLSPRKRGDNRPNLKNMWFDRVDFYKKTHPYTATISDFVDSLPEHLSLAWFVCYKYMPRLIQAVVSYAHLDSHSWTLCICPKSFSDEYKSSKTFSTLRHYISQGVSARTPFISFITRLDGAPSFFPMCKYFKKYVVSEDDYTRLYDSIGVSNFDEYSKLFNRTVEELSIVNNKKLEKQLINQKFHESNRVDINIFFLKQKFISIFAPVVRGETLF